MAQIVTITNPLTGQPAQVDQLDHTAQEIDDAIARALPGGEIDITLANKAPAGYGLGMNANSSISDADNITAFGFYTAKTNTPTNDWCAILNIPYGQNRATQFSTLGEAVSDNKYSYCKREKIDGIWKPWEWVNPRMELGVEYRTTERYLGKPVYAKARTYTFTSYYDSASQFELEIPHEISNFSSLVRAEAVSPPYMIPYVSKNGGFAGVRSVNATNILFDSYKTSWNSGDKITFKLFYTKS